MSEADAGCKAGTAAGRHLGLRVGQPAQRKALTFTACGLHGYSKPTGSNNPGPTQSPHLYTLLPMPRPHLYTLPPFV